jgi:DNA-binding SARP family transcriptional activator
MTQVNVLVQGPLHARMADADLELGPVRQQAVLGVLLFNSDRIVTPEAILYGVWGDDAPPSGKKLLPPYIYRLRRILAAALKGTDDGPSIDTLRIGYRLRSRSIRLDLDDFEEAVERAATAEAAGDLDGAAMLLAKADDTWYGEPLAGLPGPFAEGRRRHLFERRLACTERRVELDLRMGRYDAALPTLMVMRTEHPLRERIAVMLMIGLYQAGRQNEALDVFYDIRKSLATQLGMDPTVELTMAYEAILRADVRLLAPARKRPGAQILQQLISK